MFRSDDNESSVSKWNQGVSVSGDKTDSLNRQMKRQRMKPLQRQEVTQDEIAVLVAAHEESLVDG